MGRARDGQWELYYGRLSRTVLRGTLGETPEVYSLNSAECSEATDGVTRQSEGKPELSVLCSVRQAVSSRCIAIRLRLLQGQSGRTGCGRKSVRGHRGVRAGTVAGGTGAGSQEGDIPTGSDQKGLY